MPAWYFALVTAVFATVLTSFAGVVVHRVPRRIGLGGRSQCACGRELSALENVPVLGWLRVRGHAPCCGARIPRWVLVTETVALAGGAVTGWVLGGWALPVVTAVITLTTAVATWRTVATWQAPVLTVEQQRDADRRMLAEALAYARARRDAERALRRTLTPED